MSTSNGVPGCCESFCDAGPRFLIANMVVATLQLILGITIAATEIKPWNFWFGFFMIAGAVVNASVLRTSWRKTRKCGDLLGLTACLHYGHFFAGGLLESEKFSGGMYKMHTPIVTLGFLICGALETFVAFWHKRVVCPRDVNDPSHIDNQSHPRLFKIWKYSLGPMASFVFGFAESRFGSGLVPAPHSSEALIGICTACLMFALYYRKYRTSAWGSLISLIWEIVVILLFVLGIILYSTKAQTRDEHMQYGISMMVCFSYMLFFTIAFTMKFCLLKEPLHLNFSAPPIDTSKSSSVIVSPVNNHPVDLEAQPYGMTRAEAEATARKLGFNDSNTDMYLERTNTDMTDSSLNGRKQ